MILDTTISGFWLIDAPTGRLLDVNEAAVNMSGYSREALLSMHISELEHQESAGVVASHRERLVLYGFDHFETKHVTHDGRLIDVEASMAYDSGSNTFIAFLRDITEHKRIESALRSSEAKFSMAFKALPIGMLITRADDGRQPGV